MSKFTFPPEALSQHLAIVGKTGSGKTYAAKGLVESLLQLQRRVCILDPTGAWYGLRSSADGKRAGFPVAVFGGSHGDVPISEHSGGTLAKILAEKNLPAIVDLSEMLIGQRHRFVTDFAEAIYRENRSPLHLIIDEADEFIPQNPLPETKRMLHHIDRIIRRGRIRGFRVMMITQRPAVIHKNALTQANTLVTLRLTAPQDRKAIQAWIEGNGDAATGKRVLDSLARLQRGEGWVWSPELDVLQQLTFPKIATFDSSRTPDDDDVIQEPTQLAAVDIGEIRASFDQVEKEAKTLVELKAENQRLLGELASAQRELERLRKSTAVKHVSQPESAVHKTVNKTDPAEHEALEKIAKIVGKVLGVAVGAVPVAPAVIARAPAQAAAAPPMRAHAQPRAGLSGPQQRILDALAWWVAIGVHDPDRVQLAAVADYSPSSSSFTNPLGSLRTLGLIEYRTPGTVSLSADGEAKANRPAAKPTVTELHQRVMGILDGPKRRILQVVIESYPAALARADLAAAANYSESSSSFTNPLGSLRSLGLIDYPIKGMVAATPLLFPK